MTSLTLNSTLIVPSFAGDGQPAAGQVPSSTSTNNFINFCLTYPNFSIANGTQARGGSCNPAPMGDLPSVNKTPSAKIVAPKYGDTIQPNTQFIVSLAVNNMQTAIFVNAATNYLAAPQQLNSQGFIIGNAVLMLEEISSFRDAEAPVASRFAFFKGLPDAPVNGVLSTTVLNGLPAGTYRLSTELRAANHQPVLASASRHGSLGDAVYFTVGDPESAPVSTDDSGTVGNGIVPAAVNTQDPRQSSSTLDPSVIALGFNRTGQETAIPGQVSSITSENNFINYCLASKIPLSNGSPIQAGFCNPVPMGIIPTSELIPTSKFTNPRNGDKLAARQSFTISLAVRNLQTGALANPDNSFLAAPQQVNSQGLIIGHAKVVIEAITGFNQTTPTDPTKFAFFQHMNAQAQGGILTATVSGGLPDGFYRLSSILAAANSQPVISGVSQHGSINDAVYFTVGDPLAAVATPNIDTSTSSTSGPRATGSPNTSPQTRQSVDKAAIIGGVLGGLLGAIVITAAVFFAMRYRRRRRFLSDTEASRLPFASPYEEPISNPYYRREKPLPADPSNPSSASLHSASYTAESSSTALTSSHSQIIESSTAEGTLPPPYRP